MLIKRHVFDLKNRLLYPCEFKGDQRRFIGRRRELYDHMTEPYTQISHTFGVNVSA